ncbi:GAL4-like Zn(II)2Cys6 (or C6 zinc) binuclear cluster DNA-binding domain [Teratosphaeria destructans]|uniref:GAL4-like Zn(II)2Cys6 (Or C6 zinc) binuclear cluster DNA-binding domain n=1 Tax=Teratosphaeria destructans TaxID=418781 RepID=A0A9W7W1E8_9PEZI|nr:GAL4-like Zn(II)2Cys6 (or C6 zinc) binuclear cluster DNA-binding domain [Teratosphaeria destructans]
MNMNGGAHTAPGAPPMQHPMAQQSQPNMNENGSPPNQKRQRAKQACEPCRLRKRRCDGNMPCNMCTQFEYKCYFEKHPRKRSKLVEQNEALHDGMLHAQQTASSSPMAPASTFAKPEPPKGDRSNLEDATKVRSMEANSGIAFTRLLGMRLDPSSGPKLFTFGWNLGSSTHTMPYVPPITEFLAQDQMYSLAKSYFANVHPLYGFLDQQWVWEQLALRWTRPEACQMPDHLCAGIATVGSLFSSGSLSAVIPRIVESVKLVLENSSLMLPATVLDVQSWLLRVLYLRVTDHPHAVWVASCTVMHLVESTGLHEESSTNALNPANLSQEQIGTPEIRRRCFWIARMLNTWVSFEYGRTRVALRGITAQLPTAWDSNDFTLDYINLYSISCCLDPEANNSPAQWEDFLKQLESYEVQHDGIELSKANLAFCGYRRIRLANPTLSSETTNRIIGMGLKGCDAARRMAERQMPWWHVGYVPFQSVCVFLAMDVRESLAHIHTAMRTLEDVVERFKTVPVKEALKTARFLIRLSKKRKDEDSDVLGHSLTRDSAAEDPQPDNLKKQVFPGVSHLDGGSGVAVVSTTLTGKGGEQPTPDTAISNEDWNMDILNNSDFDWNYFLTADMPAFNSFAPNGTM